VPTQCGFPFPSNVFLVDDPSTTSGKHVQFRKTTLPALHLHNIDPTPWTRSDGFSPGQAALTHLPGATVTGLPTPNNVELSVTTQSPTILLEVNADGTTRLVPHFAELDLSTGAAPADQAFMIRPVERLKDQTRYIVAIRHVVDASGTALAPTPVFQALRDCTPSTDPSVGPRRALYADIFSKLSAAGISRNDLQLAWDYTTASRDNNTRDMLKVRDDALSVVGVQGPAYTISTVTDDPNPYIALRIEGTMHVPLYLTSATLGDSTARLNRGPDGLPTQNGWLDFPFLVQIPNSVAQDTQPDPVFEQGHGLLGTRYEGEDGYTARLAQDGKYVTVAINLMGFANEDINTAISAVVEEPSTFLGLVDPQHQGIVNELMAMRMMIGRFVNEPLIQYNGHSAIDPTRCFYRGDSQGGIMGATFMALSTDATRGYLGEPGMPYNLLLNRSHDFDEFYFFIEQTYQGPRQPQIILALMQMLWDRTEPDGYAPYIAKNMLPNTPAHSVMLNAALGDFQVNPLGAELMARAVGAKNLKPVNRHVYGIDEIDGPAPAGSSVLTEFNFQLDQNPDVTLPITNTPPEVADAGLSEPLPDGGSVSVDCDPHDKVRQETPVFLQTEEFFRSGQIINTCSGQSLRPPGATKPGSCQFDYTIPYTPASGPTACGPG
jgi:hypothetical protein